HSLMCKPTEAILTPKQLFDWGRSAMKTIETFFYSQTEHDRCQRFLNRRFKDAPAVPEILKNHSFI
ncbi:hypothetical protein EAG_00293, partial [Camponotus floridanus]